MFPDKKIKLPLKIVNLLYITTNSQSYDEMLITWVTDRNFLDDEQFTYFFTKSNSSMKDLYTEMIIIT